MRIAVVILIALGTTSCRQILGIDQGSVRGDAATADDGDMIGDMAIVPDVPDMMTIDAASTLWTNSAVVPGFIAGDEDPTLTSDMLELYFTRATKVYFSTRATATSTWGLPMPATFSTGGNNDSSPELTPDGLIVQFASDRGPGGGLDVYYAIRTTRTTAWGSANPLDDVNASNFNERPGSANLTGENLTLSSDRQGNLDLYEAIRTGALGSVYGAPVRMPLSTTAEDGAPFLTNDGLTLYYASGATGARDLYVATRASLGAQFTSGTKITELSTTFNDSDPWVSPDGREIYFISDRDGALRIWHASR